MKEKQIDSSRVGYLQGVGWSLPWQPPTLGEESFTGSEIKRQTAGKRRMRNSG